MKCQSYQRTVITIIIIKSYWKHKFPLISWSLSPSIPIDRSFRQHPVSPQSWWIEVFAGWSKLAHPYIEIHGRTLLMSSSLLLQQCPACLVHLTLMVFEMGGKWPYSDYCLGGAASSIYSKLHITFLCSSHQAFSLCILLASMWCIYTVVFTQPQLQRNPLLFYHIDQTSIWSITYQFQSMLSLGHILTSLSVDEILLPRYMDFIDFRSFPHGVQVRGTI